VAWTNQEALQFCRHSTRLQKTGLLTSVNAEAYRDRKPLNQKVGLEEFFAESAPASEVEKN